MFPIAAAPQPKLPKLSFAALLADEQING